MTENERRILTVLTALFEKLSEPERERMLSFIEEMAFKAAMETVNLKPTPPV